MGCRPSKQATSKVRAVEHKEDPKCLCSPRKVKKSSHKCAGVENNSCQVSEEDRSVSNKQSFSSGHRPRSARSADNDFPAFSTTTAVYRKSASKTSKITLRLSCDGSTLEIEQCDYDLEKAHGELITKPRPWSSAPNLTKLRDCKARLFRDTYIPMKHSASAWSPSVNSTVSGARGGHIRVPVLISPAEERMSRENLVVDHSSHEPRAEDKTSRHKSKESSKAEAKSYSTKDFTKSKSSEKEPLLQENQSKYSPEENISQGPHSIITRDVGESKLTHAVPNKNSRGVSNSKTLDNMIDQLEYSLELTHHVVHTSGPVSRRTRTMAVNYENAASNSCQAQRSLPISKQCHGDPSTSYTSDVSPEFEQIPVNVITSFIHPISTNANDEKNGEHNVRMSGNHNSAITKADIYYPANQPRGTNEAGNGLRKDQMALPIHNDTSILPFLTSDCPGLKSKKSDRRKGKYTNVATTTYTENVLDSKKRLRSKSESSFRTASIDTPNCHSEKVETVNKGYMFSSDNSKSSHRAKLERNKTRNKPLPANHAHSRLSSPPDPDSILTFVTLGCPVPTEMPSFMYAREDEAPLSLFTPQRHILYPYCDIYTDGPQSCRSHSTNDNCCGEDFHYDVSDEDCDLCRSYDVTDFSDKHSPLDNLTHSLIDNSHFNPMSHIRKTSNGNLYNMRANSCSSASGLPEGKGENKEPSHLLQMEQQCLWNESGLWPDQARSSLTENEVSLKGTQQVKYNGLSNEGMRKIPSRSIASGLMQEHPRHLVVSYGEFLDNTSCERKTDNEDKRKVKMTYTESYSDKLPCNKNTCQHDLETPGEVEIPAAKIDTNSRSTSVEPENYLFDCNVNGKPGSSSANHDVHKNSNNQVFEYGIDLLPQTLMDTTNTDKTRAPNAAGHCKRVVFSSEIMEPTLDYQLETHRDIYKHEISLATESADYLVELLNQDCQQLNSVSSDLQNTFRFSYDFDHSITSQDVDNLSFTDASDIEISPLTYQDLGNSTVTSGGKDKDVSKIGTNPGNEPDSTLTSMQNVKEGILQTNLTSLDPQLSSAEEERSFYSFRKERCISCAHTLSGNVSPSLLLDDSDDKESEDEVFYDAMRCEETLSQCDKGNRVTPLADVCGNYMRDMEVPVKPCLDLSIGTNPKQRSQGGEKNKCAIMSLRQAILEQNVSRMASEGVEATWIEGLHNLQEYELDKQDKAVDTRQELYKNGSNPTRTNSICDKNASSPNDCNLYTSFSMTHNPWGLLTTASARAGRQIRVESERSGLSIDAFTSGLGRPRENTESHQKGGSIDPKDRIDLNPDEFPRHALPSRCNFNGTLGSAKERPMSSLVSNSIRNAGGQEDSTCGNELHSISDSDTEILDRPRLSDSPTTNSSKQSQLGDSLTKDGNLCNRIWNSENAKPCSCEETQGHIPLLGLKSPSVTTSSINPGAQDIPCVDFKHQMTKGESNKTYVEQQHIDSVEENNDMFWKQHKKGNEGEKDHSKNVSGCNLLYSEQFQQSSFSQGTDSVTNLLNSKLEQNKIFLDNDRNKINPSQARETIHKKDIDLIEDLDVAEKCRSENENLISSQSSYNQAEQETSLKTVRRAAKLQSDVGLIKHQPGKSLMQTSYPSIDPGEFPPPCISSVSHSQSNGQYRKPHSKLNKLSSTEDLETISSNVLTDGSTYQPDTNSKLDNLSDSGIVNGSSESQSGKRSQLKAECQLRAECKLRADCQRRPRNNVLSLVRYFEKVPLVSKGHKK